MSNLQQEYNSLVAELAQLEALEQESALLDEYQALQQELASLPLTKDEFVAKRKADEEKSFLQSAQEFGGGVVEGAKMIGKQAYDASLEFGDMVEKSKARVTVQPTKTLEELGTYADLAGDILNVGGRDFIRFAKSLGGAAMDKLGDFTEEEEIDREYERYKQNFDYNTKVRPAMLESDEIEYKKVVDFGANFVDPFMALPVAKIGSMATRAPLIAAQKAATAGAISARSKGLVNVAKFAKGTEKAISKLDKGVEIAGKIGSYPTEMAARVGAKVIRKGLKGAALATGGALQATGKLGAGVEKVASLPRKAVAKVAEKITPGGGGVALGGQLVGGLTGTIPGALELGITEGVGAIARKVGTGAGQIFTTLGKPASNKRFLYRLATNEKVSPGMRKAAMVAYRNYGTALGDGAFNMLANGVSGRTDPGTSVHGSSCACAGQTGPAQATPRTARF